jgi:hypothetical protein
VAGLNGGVTITQERLVTRIEARCATMVAPRAISHRPLYVGTSVLMGLIAVVGFWPTYFGPLMRGTLAQPLLIHVHTAVFVGWLFLFLTQAVLAAVGQVTWHLRLGRFGIGYGILVVIVGLVTGISRSADRVLAGRSANGLLLDVVFAMALFSIFFGAAIAFRRTPQLHRRLMTVAATMLLVAAAGRMTFLPLPPLWLAVWALPILLAMVYDYRKKHVLHPVYLLGLAAILVRGYAPQFIVNTDHWTAIVNWVIARAT